MFPDEPSPGSHEIVVDRSHPRGSGQFLSDRLHRLDQPVRRSLARRDHQDQAVHHAEILEEPPECEDRGIPFRQNIQQVRPDRDARHDPAGNGGGEQKDDGDLPRSGVDHASQA
jgi:hypothetical protein